MQHAAPQPSLSPANQLYLYRLLVRTIGCGRQTFLPKVEEALATDRMTAEDLGFESTRALLEALDGFVVLTVFKGGRIYATVTAQPAWDAALAALDVAEPAPGAKGGRQRTNKGRAKALKPVRPRRVKRDRPAEEDAGGDAGAPKETEAKTEDANAPAKAESQATEEGAPEPSAPAEAADAAERPEDASGRPEQKVPQGGDAAEPMAAKDDAAALDEAPADADIAPADPVDAAPALEPAAALPAAPSSPGAPAPAEAAPDTPPSAAALAAYPADFAREAYLPPALDAALSSALPFSLTAAQALDQGLAHAKEAGALTGNRSQAAFSFPLPESGLTATVHIRRRSAGGAPWTVAAVELALI